MGLTSINFPNVIGIGAEAFNGCNNLEFVSIGTEFTTPTLVYFPA
jgi:hypothetical protein